MTLDSLAVGQSPRLNCVSANAKRFILTFKHRPERDFANDTEDHQRTERISPELVNGYRPEYADFIDKEKVIYF